MESYVRQFLHELRDHAGVVNTAVTLAAAMGILLTKDASVHAENLSEIDLSKQWAQRMMRRMGFVKCKASNNGIASQITLLKQKRRTIYNCDWICEQGSYSHSNCMYLETCNLTCVYDITLKFGHHTLLT